MGNFSSLGGLRQDEEFGHATPRAMELLIFRRVRGSHTALYGNTSVKVHPAQSSPFLLVNMNDPREARLLARCAPQPHMRLVGVKRALHCLTKKLLPRSHLVSGQPSRSFLTQINGSLM